MQIPCHYSNTRIPHHGFSMTELDICMRGASIVTRIPQCRTTVQLSMLVHRYLNEGACIVARIPQCRTMVQTSTFNVSAWLPYLLGKGYHQVRLNVHLQKEMGMKSLKCVYFCSNSNLNYQGEELVRDQIPNGLCSSPAVQLTGYLTATHKNM